MLGFYGGSEELLVEVFWFEYQQRILDAIEALCTAIFDFRVVERNMRMSHVLKVRRHVAGFIECFGESHGLGG